MSHTIIGVSPRSPMWVYEENYRLCLHLLPEVPEEGEEFALRSERGHGDLIVRTLELCKYTTMLAFAKPFAVDHQWLPDLTMTARLYHDARVMEVTAYQGCDRIPPRYRVEGPGRYHRDEKRQVNYLLHDLLRHCLRYDYRVSGSDVNA